MPRGHTARYQTEFNDWQQSEENSADDVLQKKRIFLMLFRPDILGCNNDPVLANLTEKQFTDKCTPRQNARKRRRLFTLRKGWKNSNEKRKQLAEDNTVRKKPKYDFQSEFSAKATAAASSNLLQIKHIKKEKTSYSVVDPNNDLQTIKEISNLKSQLNTTKKQFDEDR
eukprot:285848_1